MLKPYIIGVLSQKGGVGKTTLAVNLAVALKMRNNRVLLVDADTDNPAVGLHLGLEGASVGFDNLVNKGTRLPSTVTIHGSSGLHCVLGTLHTKPFLLNNSHVEALFKQIEESNYDFIVIDTAPGFQKEEDTMPFDDVVVVATPDLPALTSAMRLSDDLKGLKERYSLVLNRVTGKSFELRSGEIEEAWGGRVAARLPEDIVVSESLAARIPACLSDNNSEFTTAVKKLAGLYESRMTLAKKRGPRFGSWKREMEARRLHSAKHERKVSQAAIRKDEEARLRLVAEEVDGREKAARRGRGASKGKARASRGKRTRASGQGKRRRR